MTAPTHQRSDLVIVESVTGTWFYHLAQPDSATTALCGAWTMPTNLPLSAWGTVTHLHERYCKECDAANSDGGQKNHERG